MAGGVVSFGPFRLDLARRELKRGDIRVQLKGRALEVLCVLAHARGQLVTKDELMAQVWSNVVVEENNLQVHISTLRRALNDGKDGESYIVTVAGRGYRLLAIKGDASSGTGDRTAALALPLPDKPSIAVLPFVNLSRDREQEYFADGIVEEIIVGLSRMHWLFVIARNSSFAYKGRSADVKEIGRQLGVRYVLEGSVRRSAQRVRITTQLIDSSNGVHLWADRFDGAMDDIFDLQDQVTASVVGQLGPNLERAEIERAKRKPTGNLDAYDYYLRGTASAHLATRQSVDDALALLGRAIELDPEFAAPHGLAAFCYVMRKMHGWTENRTADIESANRLAWCTAELGKTDSVALAFGGAALGYVAGDLENGTAFVERALSLNHNLAFAWYASGILRVIRGGEPQLAIDQLGKAMRLSPLDPFMYVMQAATALAHFFNGTYDQAVICADKSLRENPRNPGALRTAAASHALAGRQEEAHKAIARALAIDPVRMSTLDDRISVYRRPEDYAKYRDALRKAGLPE
jgi:TolB-like protein